MTYEVSPRRASAALVAAGLLLALSALVLLALEFRRVLVRRRGETRRSALELALEAARAAKTPAERRRAAGMIARALGRGEVAVNAAELAWAEPGPEPAAFDRRVRTVEAT